MVSPRQRRWGSDGRAFVAAAVRTALVFMALGFAATACAHASLTILVGESFDAMGRKLPVGHAAVYLDRVCADSPLKLRMCRPGEPAGVAISRYKDIGEYDWLATPIMQFLYAADHAGDVLPYATREQVWALREAYRRRYLIGLFPGDGSEATEDDEWWESAGMAYSRRFWGYEIDTTREQDEQFAAAMNRRPNRHVYRAYTSNCANFAADAINLYFPGSVKRNAPADLGFTLPKQVARSVWRYGLAHPEAHLRVIEIPQIPGTSRRSWKVRGGAETFVKTRWVVPITVLQPELTAVLAGLYLTGGRWAIGRGATAETPHAFDRQMSGPETAGNAAEGADSNSEQPHPAR